MLERSRPRNRVIWVLNAACPSRCAYCDIESQRETKALSGADVATTARSIVDAGFADVVFVGGEPLLSKDLPKALEVLRGRCTVGLFTGGIPGDPLPHVETIAKGVDRLVLSIDSGKDASNDLVRGRKGITRALLDLVDAVRERLPTLDISVNTVVTRSNVAAVESVWDRMSPYGLTAWALTLAGDNFQGSPASHFLSRPEVETFYLETIPRLATRVPRNTDFIVLPIPLPFLEEAIGPRSWASAAPRFSRELSTAFDDYSRGDYNRAFVEACGCPLVGIDLTIGVGGEVHPCSQAPIIRPDMIVGKVPDTPLGDVLNSRELVGFSRRVPHEPCRRCWAPSNVPPSLLREALSKRAS